MSYLRGKEICKLGLNLARLLAISGDKKGATCEAPPSYPPNPQLTPARSRCEPTARNLFK